MPRQRLSVRSQAIARAQRRLEAESYPRLHMCLIAALTGAFGLLASFVLLRQGVEGMALRYPMALVLAYAMFLFLIWLWLRTKAEDYVDLGDLSDVPAPGSPGGVDEPMRSGGGAFGGGSASGSFDAPGAVAAETSSSAAKDGDAIGAVAEADELAMPLLALALAAGLALASLYVIYIAPVLLAEAVVDGALSFGLYRCICGRDAEHWLATAVRRSVMPFIATGVFLAVAGATMSAYVPGARSIGDVVRGVASFG
jgi:hypothetical protein